MGYTMSDILRTATEDYLKSLNLSNIPSPAKIEEDVLEETKMGIVSANYVRQKGDKLKIPQRLSTWQLARILSYLHPIKKLACSGMSNDKEFDLLALYQEDGPNKGIYVTDDEDLRKLARQYDLTLSPREFEDLKVILSEMVERVVPCTKKNLVAVNNGIFDYDTKTLMPFDPNIIFTCKSKVDFNSNAKNVKIHNDDDGTDWDVESWMATLSDDKEIVQLLWEILGAIIRPNVPWNKMAFLYSETGNNGKGTLCELMRQLAGNGSYSSIPLADMGKEFALEPLIRTSSIIVDENDVGVYIDKVGNLKAIITGDVVQINRKFKMAVPYRFRGFVCECFNELPRIRDRSDSFYRRQLFIPFTKCFTGMERKYIKEDYLHRKEVLEYVMKKVLEMDYYQLSEPQACKDALDEYKGFNDPIREFWRDIGDQLQWDLLPIDFLYNLYRVWYTRNCSSSGTPQGRNTFIKDLRQLDDVKKNWTYSEKAVRRTTRMDKAEPLIFEYDLRRWMNLRYSGSQDMNKLCVPPVTVEKYRGFTRNVSSNNTENNE